MMIPTKEARVPLIDLGGAWMPSDIALACKRQLERHQATWVARPSECAWPLAVSLRGPSDKAAANATATLRRWLAAWGEFDKRSQVSGRRTSVEWRAVRWRLLGQVTLPEKVCFEDADAVADCAGLRTQWATLKARWQTLCMQHPVMIGMPECAKVLVSAADWSDDDFMRLLEFLSWGKDHPASGLYLRQLPLKGIDTKWVERRLGVVVPLLKTILGRDGDLHQLLGLRRAPPTIRMRLLDPLVREQLGGADYLEMPVDQWNTVLHRPPARLLVVENLDTGLAAPDIRDAAVVMGHGNGITLLQKVAWSRAAEILYWGDIDTWGLHILSRMRGIYPRLESILMTEEVLESHQHFWVDEETQDMRPAEHHTSKEAKLLRDLQQRRWGRPIRLEQERVHWPMAVEALTRRWGGLA
ncbi:Wadjet anti-phage system protein JetD domain-containing protein [Burkholderia cepacia]|uniref:Wadjet anti-phage system protein JetD domain-containing protein n=1 Tax=Burkholderia cepacia TaxID=292 RepID=UPI0012D955CB|nr:DUF3322 and DUF2220 domain-containing protein [Burkholderia cepacia]